MGFDAGSQGEADCDGCNKTIYDGSYCYCQECAQKGIAERGQIGGTRALMALVSVGGNALAEWRDDEILSLTVAERTFLARVIESMNTGMPYAAARRLTVVA